jgi:hypothetical protein
MIVDMTIKCETIEEYLQVLKQIGEEAAREFKKSEGNISIRQIKITNSKKGVHYDVSFAPLYFEKK